MSKVASEDVWVTTLGWGHIFSQNGVFLCQRKQAKLCCLHLCLLVMSVRGDLPGSCPESLSLPILLWNRFPGRHIETGAGFFFIGCEYHCLIKKKKNFFDPMAGQNKTMWGKLD